MQTFAADTAVGPKRRGLGLNLCAFVLFVWFVWMLSAPAVRGQVGWLFFPVLALFVAWLMMLIEAALGRITVSFKTILAAPSLVLILIVFARTDAPLRARFALSQDAFQSHVEDLDLPAPNSGAQEWSFLVDTPRSIGSFDIERGMRAGDDVIFIDSADSFYDEYSGFAYLQGGPAGVPEFDWLGERDFVHLSGDWYSWTSDF